MPALERADLAEQQVREWFMFSDRRSPAAFWLGCIGVVLGVLLHIPPFIAAGAMQYRMAGMPMGTPMLFGMACILIGTMAAVYGLQPKAATHSHGRAHERIVAPEEAPLTPWHWAACTALAVALAVDIMKVSSLGFVIPGMRTEYRLSAAQVAVLPFAALMGATLGSFLWGALADRYGRRATILLAAVMFIGTSICGAMPSFAWNEFMCFLMGASAGGLLPVAYALLAEIMPTSHRGWSLVLVGGAGALGGYLAASGFSALLQPHFGWRIMWFLNLPSGLMLITLAPLIPESPRFLLHIGRPDEARATLERFGALMITPAAAGEQAPADEDGRRPAALRSLIGTTMALGVAGLSWGFVNFGLLLWLPGELIAAGRNMGLAAALLARSSLLAAPVVIFAAVLYWRWSTKGALLVMTAITAVGVLTLTLQQTGAPATANPLLAPVLLIIGSTGVISILLPYAAENYPLQVRGRATGWVAGCSKAGGLICQGLGALALVPPLRLSSAVTAAAVLLSLILIVCFGQETRGLDLRRLDRALIRSR